MSERDRILLLASRNAGAAVVDPFSKESKGSGNGLEQLIVAVNPEQLCDTWKRVPLGLNGLVVTGRTALRLLQKYKGGANGARLGHRIEWRIGKPVIQHCHIPTAIFHEQELFSVKDVKLDRHILGAIASYERDALSSRNPVLDTVVSRH